MSPAQPVVDTTNKTVTVGATTYTVQALDSDQFTVLNAGVPVGRIVFTFGAANSVPEGKAISEEDLTSIAEAWFAATDA